MKDQCHTAKIFSPKNLIKPLKCFFKLVNSKNGKILVNRVILNILMYIIHLYHHCPGG